MALKVFATIQITNMDNSEVAQVSYIDTVISPNPADPTSEVLLAKQMASRIVSEVEAAVQDRLDEYAQLVARLS